VFTTREELVEKKVNTDDGNEVESGAVEFINVIEGL